jgi:transcriptional antiterminator Rof (Rho-off)
MQDEIELACINKRFSVLDVYDGVELEATIPEDDEEQL